MRPTDLEPTPDELAAFLDEEERTRLARPDLSERDKADILSVLRARRDAALEEAAEDEPFSEDRGG